MPNELTPNIPADFTEMMLYKGFEGGAVYTHEHNSTFLVVIDESSIASILSPEELEGIELVKVIEFATAKARTDYLAS